MLRTYTLDTNCLIDIDENRSGADAVRTLSDAHAAGRADIAVTAISASENRQSGQHLQNFAEFRAHLVTLRLDHLNIVLPMAYLGIAFLDNCILPDDAAIDLERRIHSILFPNEQIMWHDFCRDNGLDSESSPVAKKWRNHKCDVQAIWSHINSRRQVFVSGDKNFHTLEKRPALIALGAGEIEYPEQAAASLA